MSVARFEPQGDSVGLTTESKILEASADGATQGNTSWDYNTLYDFTIILSPSVLQVYVDDVLEFNYANSFDAADGNFALYNTSQTYIDHTYPVPEPVSIALFALGSVATLRRRRR